MWMSIMILCGSVYAQSCMVITGNVLFPNKDACFEDAIKKANEMARRKLVHIPLREGRTIHHDVQAKDGSGKIVIAYQV